MSLRNNALSSAVAPALAFAVTAWVCLTVPPGRAASAEQEGAPTFESCVQDLRERAIASGISPRTANQVLGDVKQRRRVIRLDRGQPEFTQTFADYLKSRVTDSRVVRGRQLLHEQRGVLNEVQATYGVPRQYLIALWGMESNFGAIVGDIPVADSLATLSCDGRRSTLFSNQLMALLQLVEGGDLVPGQLIGSWAGAMGQVQFMPSVYLAHAVDADGDGRRDLWNSNADALASASAFLRSLGWEPGLRWGREVLLPDDFDFSWAHEDLGRPLTWWRQRGVLASDGTVLPEADVEARLLVPMGHTGPAFLVYRNFDVIRRWNRSDAFAISVGHLADRINGAGRLRVPAVTRDRMSVASLKTLQTQLNELGFDAGRPDGVAGGRTRAALAAFQRNHDLIADGFPDSEAAAAVAAAVNSTDGGQ